MSGTNKQKAVRSVEDLSDEEIIQIGQLAKESVVLKLLKALHAPLSVEDIRNLKNFHETFSEFQDRYKKLMENVKP